MGRRDNARSVWILSHRHDHMQEFNDLKVFTLINTSEIAKAVLQLQLVLTVSSFPSDPRTLTPAQEAVYFYFYFYYAHLWPPKEFSRRIGTDFARLHSHILLITEYCWIRIEDFEWITLTLTLTLTGKVVDSSQNMNMSQRWYTCICDLIRARKINEL